MCRFHLAKYDYQPNVGAVRSVSIKRVGVERVKHTRHTDVLGRVEWIESASGTTVHTRRDYLYDAGNQRTNVALEDGRRWAYGYDDLG